MNNPLVIIPALVKLGFAIEAKLNLLCEAFSSSYELLTYADSPPLHRWYMGAGELSEADDHFNQSVAQWCEQFGLAVSDHCHKTTIYRGRDIDRKVSEQAQADPTRWVILIHHGAHLPAAYREIIQTINNPILLLGSHPWLETPKMIAAIDPVHEQDRGQYADKQIVKQALTLRHALQAELSIVHSCYVPAYLLKYKASINATHQEEFDNFIADNKLLNYNHRLLQGSPDTTLPQHVKNQHANILLVGSVARGYLARKLIGSTTEHLLDHPPCDLVLIRPDTSS